MGLLTNNSLKSTLSGFKKPGSGFGFAGGFRQGALLNLMDVIAFNYDGIETYVAFDYNGIETYVATNV
nr:hypothetical protein [uncultured Draconibacterium sp.]